MKTSAGTVVYRWSDAQLQVLLVHPSGNYNRQAPWSIPKGLQNPEETLVETAQRETFEETGVFPEKVFDLGSIQYQKSRKIVHAFASPCPADARPHCGSWEVDEVEFVEISTARQVIHPDQRPLLDRLEQFLNSPRSDSGPDAATR